MVQHMTDRPVRPRAGWIVVLSLLTAVAAGIVLFAAAWVLGGRSASLPQAESVLPPEGEGAEDGSSSHEIPVDQLSQLKPLGWNVAHLQGYGLQPHHVETGVADGVRTVQVRLSDGDSFVDIAETRAEEEGAELSPLEERVTGALDFDPSEHREIQLSTGDTGEVFLSEEAERWTAAVETSYAQYVITSDMTEVPPGQLAAWVLVTDRSRLQIQPSEEPGGFDRIERGFQELFSWTTQ